MSNWASATTSDECVTSIMFSCGVTCDTDWARWVPQSITERLEKRKHKCMTFRYTHCFVLYLALIWIYADAGLNLAACPFLIMLYKATFQLKENIRSSVSQRCLLWWSPTEHVGQHSWMLSYFLSVVWFRTTNQKHLSAVRGATENNFQITETDEGSGYRTHGDIFVHFHIFSSVTGQRVASTGEHPATDITHQGQACGPVSVLESNLANSDFMHAMHHLKSSKSLGSTLTTLKMIKIQSQIEYFCNS